jgi:hypothetical protein
VATRQGHEQAAIIARRVGDSSDGRMSARPARAERLARAFLFFPPARRKARGALLSLPAIQRKRRALLWRASLLSLCPSCQRRVRAPRTPMSRFRLCFPPASAPFSSFAVPLLSTLERAW